MRLRHAFPVLPRGWLGVLAPLLLLATFLGAQPAAAATVDTGSWYVLVNRNSGKALDVYNLATNDGARITQWTRNDQAQQQWQFVDSGNGWYRIKSRHSGKVLDVYNWSTANGGSIVQWSDLNGANQQWRLADSSDGYVRLISRHSGKALEVQGRLHRRQREHRPVRRLGRRQPAVAARQGRGLAEPR
ncbi:hypothetical protein GCM10020256_01930 [Streptomyces thermocoprophilus]